MFRKGVFPAAIATACLGLVACYEYVPVQPSIPEPGAIVQAGINDAAAARLTGTLGPGIISVHGMVLRQEPDAVAVLVDNYATARNGELAGGNEPVLLNFSEISDFSIKKVSRKKSVILGLALAGGALLTATVFTDLGRQFSSSDTTSDPTQDLRRSGFRVRIPIGVRIPIPGR